MNSPTRGMGSPSKRTLQLRFNEIYLKHSRKDTMRVRELEKDDYQKGILEKKIKSYYVKDIMN